MAVTIADVAKKAHTSVATVSRVLNRNGYVSAEMKVRVEEAVRELDYKPFALSRGSIKKSLKTIGILVPDLNNLFFPHEIMGIEDELEKHDYNILLCNTYEDVYKEKKYLNSLVKKGVDGIILIGARPAKVDNTHILDLGSDLPVLMINDYIVGSEVYAVMIDVLNGAYKAVSYLIELGHRKIGFINGNVYYSTYRYKMQGYEQALSDHNIPLDERYIVEEIPYEKGGYQGAKKLMILENGPTAFFTASDQIAIGVMSAVFESGHSIPGDFSLIGFSNIPLSESVFPKLTTVDQFPYKTGKMAAEILIKLLNKEELNQRKIILEPELVIRNTCQRIEGYSPQSKSNFQA